VQLLSTDRLRLDVTIAGNREIYSWVGEDRFDSESLPELVKIGSISTGSFATFLYAIFVSDSAAFSYLGESQFNGRRVFQYGFSVPLWRSGYTIATSSLSRLTAYSGTFTADPQALDLLKLQVHSDNVAPELNICETSTTMDYSKLRINNIDFLLPAEVNTRVIDSNGMQSANRTVFSGCHQFLGESKLIFDEQPTNSETASAAKPAAVELPAGSILFTALAENIDPATSAAGDLVKGRTTKPLQIPASGLTIPKGTPLNGRICELFVQYGDSISLELGLKWESMELAGSRRKLRLSLDAAIPKTAKTFGVQVRQSQAKDETIGYFLFPEISKKYRIPAGFESRWVALPAKPAAK
jgi:hypothetical protein